MSDPAGQTQTRRFAPVAENTLIRLKIRSPLVVIAAVVGAVVSLLLTSGPAVYQTTAIMQITDSSQDSNRIKQVGQTVERTATSMAVVRGAAKARDINTADLSSRLSALWQTDTDIVEISVTGGDPKTIVQDANAVVMSLDDFYVKQTRAEVRALTAQGNDLLSSGRLKDNAAEATRRAGVGTALATQQGDAASGSTTVSKLDSATDAVATGLSSTVALVMGGFVGLVLSAGVALLLPFRRRRVRNAAEVPVLLHGIRGVSAAEGGAAEVAGLFLESERVDLAVVAMPGAEKSATTFGADVLTLLGAHGVSAGMLDATDTSDTVPPRRGGPAYGNLAAFRFLGRSGRSDKRRDLRASTLVVVTTSREEPLALLTGQGDVLAVILTKPGQQRIKDLARVATALRHSDPSVVLLS